ncbi:MAG: HAD family hydrolase [Eubacteriales bacterium]|nr:HAD family hydrolase [Eubacteriales bacterium]
MNQNYRMICSDLDQTLLMPDKTISPKTKDILMRLVQEGIYVVPSTGRAFWSMPEDVMGFPGFHYAIVSNGAAVYDMEKKEALISLTLPEEFAGQLFHFLKERNEWVTYECFIKGQAYTSQSYFDDPAVFGIPGDRERNYVQSTRVPVPDIEAFVLEHAGELDALDVIVLPEERQRVSDEIRSHFSGIYMTTSVSHLIEISNEKAGKHKAMEALAENLGFTLKEVMAFGDGDNDSEMLQAAGLGVAVAAASDLCKKAADVVIGESAEEAIADYLVSLYLL